MEASIIANASVDDLKKHQENFGKFKEGGSDREGFLARQNALFDEADNLSDGSDGTIDRAVFPTVISKILEVWGVEPSEANLDYFFQKIDADHDGKISRAEYFGWLDSQIVELSAAVNAELEKRGAQ